MLFEIDKFYLSSIGESQIDSMLNRVSDVDYKIRLVGRADSTGSFETNLILSENRVRTVSEYLIAKGVDSSLIEIHYLGESKPLLFEGDETDLQANRSVGIIIDPADIDLAELRRNEQSSREFYLEFEDDTVLECESGAQILIDAGTFFPTKISEIDFDIDEVYTVCELLSNNTSLTTTDGNCLTSAGMIYVKPTLDSVEIQPNNGQKVRIKIPLVEGQSLDSEMNLYCERIMPDGSSLWEEIPADLSYQHGSEIFYVFEVDSLRGFNLDKNVGVICEKNGPKFKIRKFNAYRVCQTYPEELYLSVGIQLNRKTFQIDNVADDKKPVVAVLAYDKNDIAFVAEVPLSELKFRKRKGVYIIKKKNFEFFENEYESPDEILCRTISE